MKTARIERDEMAALTPDELIEKAAEAAYSEMHDERNWDSQSDDLRQCWRRIARSVIAVLAAEPATEPDQTDLGASDSRPLGPDSPLYRQG